MFKFAKKSLSVVIAITILVSSLSMSLIGVNAEEPLVPDLSLITTGDTFQQGAIIPVQVKLTGTTSNSTGLVSYEAYLNYDTNVFNFDVQNAAGWLSSKYITNGIVTPFTNEFIVQTSDIGQLKIMWADPTPYYETPIPFVESGVLFTLNCYVLPGAKLGSTSLSFLNSDSLSTFVAFDVSGDGLQVTSHDLALTIASSTPPETTPSAPANLVSNATQDKSVKLSWDIVERATYNVYNGDTIVNKDNSIQTTSYTVTDLIPNTPYSFTVKAENIYGESVASNVLNVTTETTPAMPTLIASETSPTNKSVSVTITSAIPNGSIKYKIGLEGTTWTDYDDTDKPLVESNCTIYATVSTVAGSVSPENSLVIANIDTVAPTITSVTGTSDTWQKGSVTLTVNATDDASGVVSYSFDDGASWQPENTKAYSANTASIVIKVKDAAGNISTAYTTINVSNIDATAPSVTTVTGNPNDWQMDDVILSVLASDEGGSNVVEYSFDNGANWQAESTKTYTANESNIIVLVKDAAENVSTAYSPINITKIDKTSPTISNVAGNPATLQNTEVTLTVTGADAQSGIAEYSFDNGASWQAGSAKTYTTNTNGIIVKVKDAAGNVSTAYNSINITNIDMSKPVGLATPSKTNVSVGLSWTAVAGATGYNVYKNGVKITTAPITATTYTATGLTANTTYKFTVKFVKGSFESLASAELSVTTYRVAAPTGLTAVSVSYTSIKLSWTATAGAAGYYIYRSTSSTVAPAYLTFVTTNTFTNTGLATGITYYYKISAYALVGTQKYAGAYSAVVSAKPAPAAPTSLKAVSASFNSIKLTWVASAGATGYMIYRSSTSSTSGYTLIVFAAGTSYTNINLAPGTNYYYRMVAYNVVTGVKNGGAYTGYAYARTVPVAPVTFTVARASSSSIKTTWSSVAGASGYTLYSYNPTTKAYTALYTGTALSYTKTKLTRNVTYYYAVAAYRTVGATKYYGNKTAVKSAKPY